MNKRIFLPAVFAMMFPAVVLAWWNDDWTSRKQISVDTSAAGADIQETLADFPLLVRLHAGNFGYFADLAENGRDIRLMRDDKTALHFQLEKVDVLNEAALIWVRLPQVSAGADNDSFWMYYGNPDAADAADAKGVYDPAQALVYHFREDEIIPQDSTAYASHAQDSRARIQAAGWIGAAAEFTGAGPMVIESAPQFAITPEKGWTFSTWVKIDQPQAMANLLAAADAASRLELNVQGMAVSARWNGPDSQAETPPVALTAGRWQHLALQASADRLRIFLDGNLAAEAGIRLSAFTPALQIGSNFTGWLDEVQVAAIARSADWLKLAFRSQSPDFSVLNFGEDESGAAADGHFMVIVQNVTLDGWVIIGLTGIMLVVAVLVMVSKSLIIKRVNKDNRLFMARYRQLDHRRLGELDAEVDPDDLDIGDPGSLLALVGKHDHFQSSTLYHIYHAAIHELQQLHGDADSIVSAEAWNYLHVKLDSLITLQSQRLNKNMVLLTIAIAGGPFLGLLGTVVGVMITFATIAATGDVNINSIAPGIAAALLATVAGLAVAIPALFAYNYLLTQIKENTAGMRIFADEFLALLALRSTSLGNQGG